jgi:nucleoside 2-deoxyribosyltransferase
MKSIYLAGTIGGLTFDQANAWRIHAYEEFRKVGISCFSPLRGDNFSRSTKDPLPWQFPEDHSGNAYVKAIIGRDHNDVINCDLMFVNFLNSPRVSHGTMVEFGWASAYRKPIVTIMEPGNLHDHAFVTGLSTYVLDDLNRGIEVAKYILMPGV